MYDPFWLFCLCVLGEGVGGVEWIFHKPFMTWSFPKIMFSATRPAMKKSRRASTSFLSMFCTSGCRSDSSLVYRQREREMTSERYVVKEKYCLGEILHQRNIIQEKYRLREILSEMYPPTEILSTAIQSMLLTKCPDNSPGLCFCPASVWRFCGAAYHTGSSVPPERTPLPAPRSR